MRRRDRPVLAEPVVVEPTGDPVVDVVLERVALVDTATTTCDLATGSCEDGLEASADGAANGEVLGPRMTFGDMAQRLRVDADAAVGPSSTFTRDVAGQPAICVDVNLERGPRSTAPSRTASSRGTWGSTPSWT